MCSERVSGMGVGSIPITRINQYAVQQGVHDISLFEKIMMRVDTAYIKLMSDKQERQSKKGKK